MRKGLDLDLLHCRKLMKTCISLPEILFGFSFMSHCSSISRYVCLPAPAAAPGTAARTPRRPELFPRGCALYGSRRINRQWCSSSLILGITAGARRNRKRIKLASSTRTDESKTPMSLEFSSKFSFPVDFKLPVEYCLGCHIFKNNSSIPDRWKHQAYKCVVLQVCLTHRRS